MITVTMDAQNFGSYGGGGAADGTRLAGGGVELALAEAAADGATLGLWHLHGGTWGDASGHGRTLSPLGGASLGIDGAGLSRAAGQSAQEATALVAGRAEVTLEAWVRLASLPASGEIYGIAAQLYNLRLYLFNSSGAYSVRAVSTQQGGTSRYAQWSFAGPPDLGRWYHVALVWRRGGQMVIYVDGAAGTIPGDLLDADFAYASAGVLVGQIPGSNWFDGTIDEVRLSSTVRYASAFSPKRRVATGTFTSPALDGGRRGGLWLPTTWRGDVPQDTSITMESRAGDGLDAGGQVTGVEWEPADAPTARGRYLQWRATLAGAADALGMATPTLEGVTATASEAGYNIYHGVGATAEAIDYLSPVARVGPGIAAATMAGLDGPAVHWFAVRSISARGVESKTTDGEVRLELDAAGMVVPARPAGVESLEVEGASGGRVRLRWLVMAEAGEALPARFLVYGDGGTGTIDFETPLGSVAWQVGRAAYEWTSGALGDGSTVRFAVRAETDEGGVAALPAEVEAVVSATGPSAPGGVTAEVALADGQ